VTKPSLRLATLAIFSTLSSNSALALPIDWSGVFGVDTHHITDFRRTSDDVSKVDGNGDRSGTQGIASGDSGASFQTYVFKLNPQIIINDGVTLKGEFSSGYIRGGFAGGDSANSTNEASSNAYFFTTPAQRSQLNVNQMYMELYADTALVKLGRMSKHYGLGTVFNGGNQAWDRFLTMYDGVEAHMKIGNFSLIPYWAKISSYGNDDQAKPNGSADVSEMGLIAEYNNANRDLIVSIMYSKRSSESENTLYNATNSDPNVPSVARGKTDVTIINPYISKRWNKFSIAAEAPMMSGDYGNVYQDGDGDSKIAANAYIVEGKYELNPKWEVGINAGQISGDKGSTSKFEATYLHPNYQIANLMFRYHYPSFNEGTRNIFDSSISNTRYAKLFGNYKTDKWTWSGAFIFANALETASGNGRAYHHEENYAFNSTNKQADDLGYEIDLGFDYQWNPNVTISGYYGYWFVGDYYAFTNTDDELSLKNVHGGGVRFTLNF